NTQNWTRYRSACPHCARKLAWCELIPLVSFAFLGRRCSSCGQKISWQYPLVELAAGGLLVLSYVTFGATVGAVITAAAGIILLFIYIYDACTMQIPDPAVWSFNALQATATDNPDRSDDTRPQF
ncbi:prepilin peptidase, partial [Yoonia sp.]|uniref:prepilin peptidase n=1 Tax=Yoonia sp. TaxID=2212373 RepID=UPI003976E255